MSVSSTGSTTSSASSLVVNGLVSGIDTTQVIQALLQSYETPITDVEDQQSALTSQASDYKTLNQDLQSVMTAAQSLATSSSWNLMTASTSDSSVATATAAPGAQPGTLAFTVGALAQGNVAISAGGVSSVNANVTAASSLLVATGGPAVGFSALTAGSGLALGAHTIDVTQSSAAASVESTSALAPSTTITTGTNDELDLSVNATSYALTIAPGTSLTPSQLVSAINTAASTADAAVSASLSPTGALQLSTTEQGSDASLQVTGGSALSSLGLTAGPVSTGADAVVSVDGVSTTLQAINPNAEATLNAPSGAITVQIASTPNATGALVATGSVDAALVSTGNGSLANVVSSINNSGLAVTATAVNDASGLSRLQVSASATGLAGEATIDDSSLSSGPLGNLTTITAAQDASISVGGAGGYTLTSSNDTFSNLMAGTSITVAGLGQTTATVAADAAGEASNVATLVSAANQTLTDINNLTSYNPSTNVAGPLLGSALAENLQNQIESIFASVGGASGLGNTANVGITLNSDGTLTFNQQAFETAFSAQPQKVASLFTQGGTFSSADPANAGDVSLVYGGNSTDSGSYDVAISQSAEPATDTGTVLAGGVTAAPETLTIGEGNLSTIYSVSSGESLATVANGLNVAFGAAGLDLTAQLLNNDTQLSVTSNGYGSAAQFSISSSAPGAGTTGLGAPTPNTAASYAGVDVVGTINGVAGTGTGQILAAPADDPTLNGLSLQVTTPGITAPTDLGTFSYSPGVAQQLVTIANAASNASTGSLTTTINGLTAEAKGLNSQISSLESLATNQQTVLQKEFAAMETTLGQLKNESSSLTSVIGGLTTL